MEKFLSWQQNTRLKLQINKKYLIQLICPFSPIRAIIGFFPHEEKGFICRTKRSLFSLTMQILSSARVNYARH